MAAYESERGVPTNSAISPHNAAPPAKPPCRTSKYMEMARARMWFGHMVCAATFRLARIWIQATPATNIVTDSSAKVHHSGAAYVVKANTAVDTDTSASVEMWRRRNG